VNREEKSETTPAPPPNHATNSPPNGSERRKPAGSFHAKLPFFRTMLWVLIYALVVVFFFSLILLGGFRFQTKVIGGALLACIALVILTYVLHWRD
jgi:hypothetical protein